MAQTKAKAKAVPTAKKTMKAAAKVATAPVPPSAKSTAAKPPPSSVKPAKHAVPKKPTRSAAPILRSIRSVIYQVDDLARARAFYAAALDRKPYFDEPFYIGFDVDGQELGLHPDNSQLRPGPGGAVAYWRVDDIRATWDLLLALGAGAVAAPHDVGGGITTGILADPFGNLVGLIQGA